jgi:hypothetical protein
MMQIEKIEEAKMVWDRLDSNSLVVFDIDDVIISTEDHFAHPYGYLKFVGMTNEALSSATTTEEKDEIMRKVSLSQLLAKRNLVESDMPTFIQSLQKAGVKVIALTNFPRGQYGAILRTETWRIEYLKALNIDFSLTAPFKEMHEFTEFQKNGLLPPLFEEGILFANSHLKGQVLEAFFEKSQFYPREVIFIDDIHHNHVSVEASMKSLNIPFLGLHYLGAAKKFSSYNESLLRHQFDHLMKTETWLSDKEILQAWQAFEEAKDTPASLQSYSSTSIEIKQ